MKATTKEQEIEFAQANDEFETWQRDHRKEEVAALKNQIHANLESAPTKFRNIRRLTIFTRMNHFVAPESNNRTYTRTRAVVKTWLNELLLTKKGASFEKVIVHVRSEVVNEVLYVKPEILELKYVYAGRKDADGDAEILEDNSLFYVAVAEAREWR